MNVIINVWPNATVQAWAALLTRLAERYPNATLSINDPLHLRLVDQREWDMKDDKEFFTQLYDENVIANWGVPYPGKAED